MKNVTSKQLILKNTTLQKCLRSILLFNSEFDLNTLFLFTNDEDNRGKWEQRGNLLIKKVR